MTTAGIDALVVAPGSDLRYLTGYDAHPDGAADGTRAAGRGLAGAGGARRWRPPRPSGRPPALAGHADRDPRGDRRRARAGRRDGRGRAAGSPSTTTCGRSGCSRSARVLPDAEFQVAGRVLSDLRMRKGSDEVAALRQAGAAIDRVHARMARVPQGRPHRAAGRRGDRRRDPRGGPRSRSTSSSSAPDLTVRQPHHSLSDRVIEAGRLGGGRHRRYDGRGLLLGLHPHLRGRRRTPRPR